jgi:hypothetical protein
MAFSSRCNRTRQTLQPEAKERSWIAALYRHDAEFGQVSAQGIAQHGTLALAIAGPARHQGGLLSFVLIGTNRIDGRVTASQIAAASFASFLPRLR